MAHRVKYFTDNTVLTTNLNVPVGGVGGKWASELSYSPQYISYQNLFDQFTIVKFSVKLIPLTGQYQFGSSPAVPILFYAINRDGASDAPITLNTIMGEDNAKSVPLNGTRMLKIAVNDPKPYLAQTSPDQSNEAIQVSQPLKKWVWIDTKQGVTLPFYGINYWITNSSGAAINNTYQILFQTTYAFKEQQ